jgi:meso-butanediol dehydrogenase/(S,S)-butanediol dehydrogenase/diacetyl reductase
MNDMNRVPVEGSLKERVVIVTGAGRGVGFGVAETFGGEVATVVIGELVEGRGCEAADALRAKGYRAHALCLDVTKSESCAAVAEQVWAEHGRIDVLVNNAGVYVHHASEETPEADWRVLNDDARGA